MSLERGRSKYEEKATEEAWQNGIEDADSPGQGLQDAGVSNLNVSRFDGVWEEGVEEGEYEPDGDKWFSQMSDANNWNY